MQIKFKTALNKYKMVLKRLALNWDHHDAPVNSAGECCLWGQDHIQLCLPTGQLSLL